MGPDGAGKTTLATALLHGSQEPTGYTHFRPSPFRALRTGPDPRPVAGPEKHRSGNPPIGWLRLGSSVLRFWIGYLVRVLPLLRRGGTVVADRWAYGYVAQPQALRFYGPGWLARLAMRIVPTPDLVVNLTGPPEVIAERKGELTLEELIVELDLWRSLPVRSMLTLDVSASPGELVETILNRIEEIFGRPVRRDGNNE